MLLKVLLSKIRKSYAHEAGKGLVFVVNKWDLYEKQNDSTLRYQEEIRKELVFCQYAPVVFVSAVTKQRIHRLPEVISYCAEQNAMRVATSVLNQVLEDAVAMNPTPTEHGTRLKILYATQVKIKPPTFVVFVNDPEIMHFSYQRYLENKFREAFGFEGTPIRFFLRNKNKSDEDLSDMSIESTFEGGDTGRGIHYGTSNAAVSYLSLNAEFQDYKIAQIEVWCADSDATATVVANIDNAPIGEPQTISNTNDSYIFNVEKGSEKQGSLSIYISRESKKKALFCKEIRVTYLKEEVPVTGVSIDKDRLDIEVESSGQLTATITPDNADNKNVSWKSDNEAVATVDSNGLVTGQSAGVATITVTTNDGNFITRKHST